MAFNISEYPEKDGILIGIPGDLDNSGVLGNNFAGLPPGVIPRWENYTVKYYDLQSSTGIFTGHMFDYRQDRDFVHTTGNPGFPVQGFEGRGINRFWVSPTGYKYGNNSTSFTGKLFGTTGIIITYPPSVGTSQYGYRGNHPEDVAYDSNPFNSQGTGVFNFVGFLNNFSNGHYSKLVTGAAGIDDFTIFNDYIHYLPTASDKEVRVPFVSDLVPTTDTWDRYGGLNWPEGQQHFYDEATHNRTDPDYSSSTEGS